MLAVLTAAVLVVALILALISPRSTFTVVVGALGAFLLFPITFVAGLLFLGLSATGGVAALDGLESTLQGLFTGAHGFGWGYYLALCVPLWLGVVLRIGSINSDETAETTTDESDHEADGTADTAELTDISGVTESSAHALREAGYNSVDDIRDASQDELVTLEGISMERAAIIKADSIDEADETVEPGVEAGNTETVSVDDADATATAHGADARSSTADSEDNKDQIDGTASDEDTSDSTSPDEPHSTDGRDTEPTTDQQTRTTQSESGGDESETGG